MKISILQLSSNHDKAANLQQASALMTKAVESEQPDILLLPEMFSMLGGSDELRREFAENIDDPNADNPSVAMLSQFAANHNVTVHGGSICEYADGKFYNTTLVFDPSGKIIAKYRKIHLFDATMTEGLVYCESNVYSPGKNIVCYKFGDFRIGCSICFDVRFGELFHALANLGAKIIMVPSAFAYETGKAHWEILLRARAIETQCYIVAAAQTGNFNDGEKTKRNYGHSMIVNPWGDIVCQMGDETGFISADLNFSLLDDVRNRLPIQKSRRL